MWQCVQAFRVLAMMVILSGCLQPFDDSEQWHDECRAMAYRFDGEAPGSWMQVVASGDAEHPAAGWPIMGYDAPGPPANLTSVHWWPEGPSANRRVAMDQDGLRQPVQFSLYFTNGQAVAEATYNSSVPQEVVRADAARFMQGLGLYDDVWPEAFAQGIDSDGVDGPDTGHDGAHASTGRTTIEVSLPVTAYALAWPDHATPRMPRGWQGQSIMDRGYEYHAWLPSAGYTFAGDRFVLDLLIDPYSHASGRVVGEHALDVNVTEIVEALGFNVTSMVYPADGGGFAYYWCDPETGVPFGESFGLPADLGRRNGTMSSGSAPAGDTA